MSFYMRTLRGSYRVCQGYAQLQRVSSYRGCPATEGKNKWITSLKMTADWISNRFARFPVRTELLQGNYENIKQHLVQLKVQTPDINLLRLSFIKINLPDIQCHTVRHPLRSARRTGQRLWFVGNLRGLCRYSERSPEENPPLAGPRSNVFSGTRATQKRSRLWDMRRSFHPIHVAGEDAYTDILR